MAHVIGLGAVSAAGGGVDALRAALDRGPVARPFSVAAEDPAAGLGIRGMRALSRASRLACAAAAGAVCHPESMPGPPERCAVALGTRWGSLEPLVEFERVSVREGPHLVNPAHFPNTVVNVHAGYLGIFFGLAGPNVTLCGPAAGLEAIGQAADLLALDRADRVLAGGADDLGPSLLAGMRTRGEVPGEAAAMLLLSIDREGASATLAGFGRAGQHDAAAARREAVEAALLDAGVQAREVAVAWCSGAGPPPGAALGEGRRLEPVTGACRAADGALAAVMAADDAARLGAPALATAFPAMGPQFAAVMCPA